MNSVNLAGNKKAAIESCFDVPVETVLDGREIPDKNILTFLILKYQPITFYLYLPGVEYYWSSARICLTACVFGLITRFCTPVISQATDGFKLKISDTVTTPGRHYLQNVCKEQLYVRCMIGLVTHCFIINRSATSKNNQGYSRFFIFV